MANGVFNVAKGKVNEYVARVDSNDPTNSALVVVLLKASEADGTLEDYDNLDALLGAAGNTEADFSPGYSRKILTDTDVTAPSPDDANNRQDASIPNQTWTSAGGTTNNTLTKLLVCYDPDTTAGLDSSIIPLTHHDFSASTNGGDLTAEINAAGFFRAS